VVNVDNKQKTVMVVDDDKHVRGIVRRILEDSGRSVVTASTGWEALEKLFSGGIDLVLLDIMMPEINGFQVLKMIRDSSNIPVMIITALPCTESLLNSLNIAADDYINKPFKTDALLARIEAKFQ